MKLQIFPRALNVPNPSPFCAKLETWLLMAGIEHEVEFQPDPRKAPKGKLPAVVLDNGSAMGDSGLIIDALTKQHNITMDSHLSAEQRGYGYAVERLCEEHLYWGILYSRWVDARNWSEFRNILFTDAPAPIRPLIGKIVQRKICGQLQGTGLLNHSEAEMYQLCIDDVNALADILGDKTWLFGEQPSRFDATLFGTVVNLTHASMSSPLAEAALQHDNLKAYASRVLQQYYPASC